MADIIKFEKPKDKIDEICDAVRELSPNEVVVMCCNDDKTRIIHTSGADRVTIVGLLELAKMRFAEADEWDTVD